MRIRNASFLHIFGAVALFPIPVVASTAGTLAPSSCPTPSVAPTSGAYVGRVGLCNCTHDLHVAACTGYLYNPFSGVFPVNGAYWTISTPGISCIAVCAKQGGCLQSAFFYTVADGASVIASIPALNGLGYSPACDGGWLDVPTCNRSGNPLCVCISFLSFLQTYTSRSFFVSEPILVGGLSIHGGGTLRNALVVSKKGIGECARSYGPVGHGDGIPGGRLCPCANNTYPAPQSASNSGPVTDKNLYIGLGVCVTFSFVLGTLGLVYFARRRCSVSVPAATQEIQVASASLNCTEDPTTASTSDFHARLLRRYPADENEDEDHPRVLLSNVHRPRTMTW